MIKMLLDQNIPALIEPWLKKKIAKTAKVTSTRTLGMQRKADDELFVSANKT